MHEFDFMSHDDQFKVKYMLNVNSGVHNDYENYFKKIYKIQFRKTITKKNNMKYLLNS